MTAIKRSAFVCIFILAALFSCTVTRGQEEKAVEEAKLLAKAIEGIIANYAHLTSIRAKFYKLYLDPKVQKKQEKVIELKGGGTLTYTESPSETARSYFTAKGPDYRVEYHDGTIYTFKNGELTQRRPSDNRVETKPLAAWGGLGTLDPRNLGGIDLSRSLLSQLKASQATAVKQLDNVVQITTEITKDGKRLNRRTYDFDTKRNWLPTRILTWRDEDLINDLTEFEYDEVLPDVWFMKRVTEKYAGLYQIREITPEVEWSQTTMTLTFGKPEFNVSVTDEELTSLTPTRR